MQTAGAARRMDALSPKKRSWVMAQVKSAGNRSTEKRMVAVMRQSKITGWRRRYPLFGKPDFVFPVKRVALFVDGCFWHGHPVRCRIPQSNRAYWLKKIARNVARDKVVGRVLKEKGWKVVRIWEDSITKTFTVMKLRKALV